MNSTEQAVLGLLSESLFGIPAQLPDGGDWNEVFQEAQDQTVSGLMGGQEFQKAIPESKILQYQIITNSVQHLHEQYEVVKLLERHDIPSAILKGSAAAIYYPQPCLRTMGDIDIIVPQNCFEAATELMTRNGYTDLTADSNLRHTEFSKNGILIELHHHFSGKDLDLEQYIIEGLNQRETAKINGISFPMLPPIANGVVLLDHMKKHLRSGLGLRQVIDWMMYVDKVLDNENWEKSFKGIIEELGLEKLAITVTRMCQIYLGLSERITWCQEADEKLCKRLIEVVLSSGNFGRKNDSGNRVESVFVKARRGGLFRYLQENGEKNWEVFKRYGWLRPFCWIYQICYFIRCGIATKRGFILFMDLKRSKERYALLKELHIE